MELKKIMLVKPGRWRQHDTFGQPLGLLYLIAILRQRYGGKYRIKFIEQALYDLTTEDLLKQFKDFSPDLVGFSALTEEAGEMEDAARVFKEENPQVKVVLGGPHGSLFYDRALLNKNIDYVCLNEAERTFPALLEALERNDPIDKVPGLALRIEDKVVLTPPEQDFIENLDGIPFPAWDYIDFERYSRQISMNGYCHSRPWAIIFTSRGCPFKCAYCHHLFGKRVRKRSGENVIDEIKLLRGFYKVKEIQICDDIFNFDLARAKNICDEIVNQDIEVSISFPNGVRADLMDRELIQKLKAAGCYSITYAIETASPRLQKLIGKNLDLEKAKQAIEWTYQEGIIPQAFVMLGFPTEVPEEIQMTLDWIMNSKILRCVFFSVVVYPRTDLFEIVRQHYPDFDFSDYHWSDFYYNSETPFYSRVTPYDGQEIRRDAYRKFYFRLSIILKILWWFPKNTMIIRRIWWGLRKSFSSFSKTDNLFRSIRKLAIKSFSLLLLF